MKGLYRRGDVWWMRFVYQGKLIRRSTETSNEKFAEDIYCKVRTKIIEGKWFEVDPAKEHTFDEMIEKFMIEHAPKCEPTTQRRFKSIKDHLMQKFSGMTLSSITPKSISEYIEFRRGEGAAGGTINREFAMLSKAFSLAWKRWEWCKENPCSKVQKELENNRIDRWLTPKEEERLMFHSQGYLDGQLPEIIILALHTAMRQGEILNLRWQDVDLFRKVIIVSKTKNKEPKTIPMTDTLYELLKDKSKVVSMSGFIFVSRSGTKIDPSKLQMKFRKTLKMAEIERFRFHDLRHTAATRMVQAGVDLYTVSKILGHRDLSTTQRYAHHCPESLRGGIKVLGGFGAKKSTITAQSNVNEAK